MDWCIDTAVPGAEKAAEMEICAHLARHVLDPLLVELARPVVSSLLADVRQERVWVRLEWEERAPKLLLRSLPGAVGTLPGTLVGPGVTRAHLDAARLSADLGAAPAVVVELELARAPETDLDPVPADPAALPEGFPSAVGAHLAEQVASGSLLETAAARTGATLAARLAPDPDDLEDLEVVATAFIDAERELGGHFDLLQRDGNRAVFACRRCPFGPAPAEELCRFTSALAGGLGARLAGSAEVVIDERIALGDVQCRLVLETGPPSGRVTAHHYRWPPSGTPASEGADGDDPTGFRIRLSLALPRDRVTIPVARHLTRAALERVGVVPDDAHEVELALSEACGNVVEHAEVADCYEVTVLIGPVDAELRVVDQGRGFDFRSLGTEMASPSAERGRGVALMRALVDQVRFESRPEVGTIVRLVKALRFDDTAPTRRMMLEALEATEEG